MPILQNPANVMQVEAKGVRSSQGSSSVKLNFVFHYRRTTVGSGLTKAALETVFQSAIMGPILAALNNTYTQTNTDIRQVNNVLDGVQTFPEVGVGAVTGDSMPSTESAYILMRSGNRGGNFRGSKHFGPLSESDTTAATSDILNAAAITRFAAIVTAISTPLTDALGNVWQNTILSRTYPATQLRYNPTNFWVGDVVEVILNKRIGTMRRRRVASVY